MAELSSDLSADLESNRINDSVTAIVISIEVGFMVTSKDCHQNSKN